MRRAMLRLLEPNADVVAVADGASALDCCTERRFDLVITDYHLPDMSGLELLRRLRTIEPSLQRVVISGSPMPDLLPLIRNGLVHHFLLKPVPVEAFMQLLEQAARARCASD
jgi:CheY-like chemotaxis protein